MGIFMGYMLQVSVIMTILFLVYKLLMSGLSFHSFNRKIILVIYLLSWSLPFFIGSFSCSGASTTLTEIENLEMVKIIVSNPEPVKKFDWASTLAIIYFSGILIMTGVTVLSIWKMISIIRKAQLIRSTTYSIKVSHNAPGPFSWGKYIILTPSDIDDSLDMVIEHEEAHLRKWHWIDLIPARISIILQWFSPAAWLLARELREVHEFEVDEIAAGDKMYEYQLMLIKKTAGSRFPVFADSLNHSQIKKRLTMMRKKSNPNRRVAALALPLAALASVVLISQPVIAHVVEQLANADLHVFSDDKVNENERTLQTGIVSSDINEVKIPAITDRPSLSNQNMSTDDESLYKLLAVDNDSNTGEKSSTPSKLTYFVDGKKFDGAISDIDPSTIASMEIIKNDPAYPDSKVMITTKKADSSEENMSDAIEKSAEFKGGEKELIAFLIENIQYPKSEMNSPDNTVRVILSFNILTDGSVDDIEVKKSGGEAYDAEAINVVKKTSGRWVPAEIKGKAVVSQFTIPITFKKKG